MNKIFLSIFFLFAMRGYSQDILKLKLIDSMVAVINKANLYTQHDSTIQNFPKLGLNMKTYLTMVKDQGDLKKFVNKVIAISEENGIKTQMISSSSFYFDQNKLIKVEESGTKGEKEFHADWYYSGGKPLYYTLQSDGSEERANALLEMSAGFIKTQKTGFK